MTFNEFNRRLEKCHLDEDTKYLLTHIFEVVMELSKQLDGAASILDHVVGNVQAFVSLHESTQAKMRALMQREPGVEVHSVRNEPED